MITIPRMRFAMCLAMLELDKAKSEFLKAFNNECGVLQEADETALVSTKNGFTNPLGEIKSVWNEAYMSVPMESILNGYEDPRRGVWFLRAEAALRGCSGESVEICYEKGVIISFRQYGILRFNDYLNSNNLPDDFIDTHKSNNGIKVRCLITPRWIEAADREVKLEKIIIQKWIAMFTEGCEAWAE